jgi:Flp pilus assembly pilin Flp
MRKLLERLVGDESGQDVAEYGIALLVVTIGVGLAAIALASDVNTLWTTGSTAIGAVAAAL